MKKIETKITKAGKLTVKIDGNRAKLQDAIEAIFDSDIDTNVIVIKNHLGDIFTGGYSFESRIMPFVFKHSFSSNPDKVTGTYAFNMSQVTIEKIAYHLFAEYKVSEPTPEADPDDYAVSQEALEVATNAEIELANSKAQTSTPVIDIAEYNTMMTWAEKVSNGQRDAVTPIKTYLSKLGYTADINEIFAYIEMDDLNGFRRFISQFPFRVKDNAGYIQKLYVQEDGQVVLAEIPTSEYPNTENNAPKFRYYIKSRRPIAGAVPKGYISATEGEMKAYSLCTDGSVSRVPRKVVFGVAVYDHPLSDEQIINYDLHVDPRNSNLNTETQEDTSGEPDEPKFETGKTYYIKDGDSYYTLKVDDRTDKMLTGTTPHGTCKYHIHDTFRGEYIRTHLYDDCGNREMIWAANELTDPIIQERLDALIEYREFDKAREAIEKDCDRFERLRDRCKSGSPKRKEYNQLIDSFNTIIRAFGEKFIAAQDRYNKSLTLRTGEEITATQKAIDEHNADLDARGIKYFATVYYFPNGIEGEDMENFSKECTSLDEANAFVSQEDIDGVYVGGIYDAGWQITDRNHNLIADHNTGIKEETQMTNTIEVANEGNATITIGDDTVCFFNGKFHSVFSLKYHMAIVRDLVGIRHHCIFDADETELYDVAAHETSYDNFMEILHQRGNREKLLALRKDYSITDRLSANNNHMWYVNGKRSGQVKVYNLLQSYGLTIAEFLAEDEAYINERIAAGAAKIALKDQANFLKDKIARDAKPCDDNDDVFNLIPDVSELNDVEIDETSPANTLVADIEEDDVEELNPIVDTKRTKRGLDSVSLKLNGKRISLRNLEDALDAPRTNFTVINEYGKKYDCRRCSKDYYGFFGTSPEGYTIHFNTLGELVKHYAFDNIVRDTASETPVDSTLTADIAKYQDVFDSFCNVLLYDNTRILVINDEKLIFNNANNLTAIISDRYNSEITFNNGRKRFRYRGIVIKHADFLNRMNNEVITVDQKETFAEFCDDYQSPDTGYFKIRIFPKFANGTESSFHATANDFDHALELVELFKTLDLPFIGTIKRNQVSGEEYYHHNRDGSETVNPPQPKLPDNIKDSLQRGMKAALEQYRRCNLSHNQAGANRERECFLICKKALKEVA